jgi:hypothetical protein
LEEWRGILDRSKKEQDLSQNPPHDDGGGRADSTVPPTLRNLFPLNTQGPKKLDLGGFHSRSYKIKKGETILWEFYGKPIETWQGMADHLGRTVSWLKTHRKELFDEAVIFTKLIHRPPNRRKLVYTYSYLLDLWWSEKLRKMKKTK